MRRICNPISGFALLTILWAWPAYGQLQMPAIVPGSNAVYTDGVNTWSGNPFCSAIGVLLQPTSPAIDAGVVTPIHCPTAGFHPGQSCIEWYGTAPDIGACEWWPQQGPVAPPLAPVAVQVVQGVADWVHCAEEGETCQFTGTKTVRYGAVSTYVTKVATDGIACDNATFGDPLYGVAKHCDVWQ